MAKIEILHGKAKGKVFDLPVLGEGPLGNRRGVPIPLRESSVFVTQAILVAERDALEVRDGGPATAAQAARVEERVQELEELEELVE